MERQSTERGRKRNAFVSRKIFLLYYKFKIVFNIEIKASGLIPLISFCLNIKVKGRENYLILKKIAESLEIQRVYTNMKKLNPETLNKNSALAIYKNSSQIENKSSFLNETCPMSTTLKHASKPNEITLERLET